MSAFPQLRHQMFKFFCTTSSRHAVGGGSAAALAGGLPSKRRYGYGPKTGATSPSRIYQTVVLGGPDSSRLLSLIGPETQDLHNTDP
jgi:hypothetical protein